MFLLIKLIAVPTLTGPDDAPSSHHYSLSTGEAMGQTRAWAKIKDGGKTPLRKGPEEEEAALLGFGCAFVTEDGQSHALGNQSLVLRTRATVWEPGTAQSEYISHNLSPHSHEDWKSAFSSPPCLLSTTLSATTPQLRVWGFHAAPGAQQSALSRTAARNLPETETRSLPTSFTAPSRSAVSNC